MKIFIMCMLAVSMMICSCGNGTSKDTHQAGSDGQANVYNDATLRQICEYRCDGNTAELVKMFFSEYPEYRKAAISAVGCMRDSMAIVSLATLLSDPDVDIRTLAVFAIGQTCHPVAEKYLLDALSQKQPDVVIAAILVALAKCGGVEALKTVENLDIPHSNVVLISALSRALCLFAQRGLISVNTSQTAISILCDTTIHEKARTIAAQYFGIGATDFSLYTDEFVSAYRNSHLVSTKANIMLALGKCHNQRAFMLLKSVVSNDSTDYRVMMNAIAALDNYPYEECKPYINTLLHSNDEKVSYSAAQYIYRNGQSADAHEYMELSRDVQGWQTRTTLLSAALRYSDNKENIANGIKSGFDVAQNIYEKASLLKALETDVTNFRFVENHTFYSDDEMIRTEGLKTLVKMYESPEFARYAASLLETTGEKLRDEFAIIFKTAVQNGNTDMVAVAASAIARHSEIAEYYINTFFLNQALAACVLPRDADTYTTLVKAIKEVNGQDIKKDKVSGYYKPDWDYLRTIPQGQELVLTTRSGDIIIRTNINAAPMAVANFMKLVDDGYFNNSKFNGVNVRKIESDGSLSSFDRDKTVMIPQESGLDEMDEGIVALESSALNNSYTTHWLIMTGPDALMDGNYSVIGTVVAGMDVVYSICTGDEIISIKRR